MVSSLTAETVKKAIGVIRAKSTGKSREMDFPVTINFHPDRFTKDGLPILASIARDGQLKSQFETRTSNGGLTAYPGGDRWLWENRVFDGAYDDAPSFLRPKYGALNYNLLETGAAPRFGSAFFSLNRHVTFRTTFCYPDSFFEPDNFASHEFVDPLIQLLNEDSQDELDSYIEAHVHGVVTLGADVDYLALDPIFKGTVIETQAQTLPVDIRWHSGYDLSIDEIEKHTDYRGLQFVEFAREISENNRINPFLLGLAVNSKGYDAQDAKKVWHYLARFGYNSRQIF